MNQTSEIQTSQSPAWNVQVNSIVIIHRDGKSFASRVYEKADNGDTIVLKTTMGVFAYEHTDFVQIARLY